MNPASLAKQQRLEDQLQLREECERLREMVKVLEGGRSLPERLEGAVSLQSPQEVTGRYILPFVHLSVIHSFLICASGAMVLNPLRDREMCMGVKRARRKS